MENVVDALEAAGSSLKHVYFTQGYCTLRHIAFHCTAEMPICRQWSWRQIACKCPTQAESTWDHSLWQQLHPQLASCMLLQLYLLNMLHMVQCPRCYTAHAGPSTMVSTWASLTLLPLPSRMSL